MPSGCRLCLSTTVILGLDPVIALVRDNRVSGKWRTGGWTRLRAECIGWGSCWTQVFIDRDIRSPRWRHCTRLRGACNGLSIVIAPRRVPLDTTEARSFSAPSSIAKGREDPDRADRDPQCGETSPRALTTINPGTVDG